MKGHIKITDKVYFKPDELPKPTNPTEYSDLGILTFKLRKAWSEYEASKKTVEVSNVYFSTLAKAWLFKRYISHKLIVKNNQECEAEVTETALITKLL